MDAHGVQLVIRFVWISVMACLTGALGCEEPQYRNALNTAVQTLEIDTDTTLNVEGSSLVWKKLATSAEQPHQVNLRAQSLDVRLDVVTNACGPMVLQIGLSQLANRQLKTSYRVFLDTTPEPTAAALGALGGAFEPTIDPHEQGSLPLTSELAFDVTEVNDPSSVLKWTLCMNRQGLHARLLPGWATQSDCGALFATPVAPCAVLDTDVTGRTTGAPMRIRIRLRNQVSEAFTFAIWGNGAGQIAVLDQIIEGVNAASPTFALVSGDMTEFGEGDRFANLVDRMDSQLAVPWFGTLGDRDIRGSARERYSTLTGTSNFAFDVGSIRIVVLDSANGSLGLGTLSLMERWLSPDALSWPGDPSPAGRIVVTHIAPFDPYGSRGLGFRDRNEGATVTSKLLRSGASHLFTSHLATYRTDELQGMQLVHSGGAGARLESATPEGHHWLLVSVDPKCQTATTETRCPSEKNGQCPCIDVSVQPVP